MPISWNEIKSRALTFSRTWADAASTTLGRKINPTLYTPAELNKRFAKNNAFVTRVLQQPKIWLIGNEEHLHVTST